VLPIFYSFHVINPTSELAVSPLPSESDCRWGGLFHEPA
jgi:hypothetical protein